MDTIETIPGDRRELKKLLKEYDTALLITRSADGHFHSRPMAMQEAGVDEIWFATSDESGKVHDLEHDAACCVSLLSSEHASSYVSLSGKGEIVRDRAKVRALWNFGMKVWFPDGPDDSDIALIRFVPELAEYVVPAGGKIAVVATMVGNLLGQPSEPAPKKELELH